MPRCSVFFTHRRVLRAGLCCLFGLTMAGCAVVEEFHSDGTASRSLLLGSPVIWSRPPGSQGEAIKATGLGLSVLNGTSTLGWFDASVVAVEPGCRVVLVGNTDEQLRTFSKLAGNVEGICGNAVLGAKQ
jgi:hypothetical protein